MKQYLDKWKSSMNDRERFNNQMRYKPVDRCFNMEFGYWEENFKAWPLFRENGIANNEDAHAFFGFDRIEVLECNVWLHPVFPEKTIEERGNTKIVMNSDGLTAEIPLDEHDTIPHYIESSIKTPADWERVKKERLRVDDPARRVDVEALKRKHPENRDYPLGVYCGSMIGKIRDMLTFEGLAYATYDYPDMLEDMVETACLLTEHFLDQVLQVIDFDYASGWEDICFKNGPIVSVDFFRSVVVPRYKRIHQKLASSGIDLWYTDCDGDVRPLLPFFLESGINCLFPYEVNSCTHPVDILEENGKALKIMGGIDKRVLIEGPKATEKYLESVIPIVRRGGYIPFCDHRCPPDVSPEHYLYYLNLKRELFGYGGKAW